MFTMVDYNISTLVNLFAFAAKNEEAIYETR